MPRSLKYGVPTVILTARASRVLARWIDAASGDRKLGRSDILIGGAELLLGMISSRRRPSDHEFTPGTADLLHEAQAGTRVRAALASIRSAGPLTPEAQRVVDAVEAALL